MVLEHETSGGRSGGRSGGQDVAPVRLLCLVRSGDGYLLRAVARLSGAPTGVDISFGGPRDQLETAVRLIQRWCDDGTTLALVDADSHLALRAPDGTEVALQAA